MDNPVESETHTSCSELTRICQTIIELVWTNPSDMGGLGLNMASGHAVEGECSPRTRTTHTRACTCFLACANHVGRKRTKKKKKQRPIFSPAGQHNSHSSQDSVIRKQSVGQRTSKHWMVRMQRPTRRSSTSSASATPTSVRALA